MKNVVATRSITLSEIIKETIQTSGPIPFSDFMRMALYHPELGYYTSLETKIGADGDYYTSPAVTPILGIMIAKQVEEMWNLLNKGPFAIVEYGAGSGALCLDILSALKQNSELYKNITYYIIEKGPGPKKLNKFKRKVQRVNSLEEIGPVTGCILSNELLDNFPVHRVIMKDELKEVFVGYDNGFFEFLEPASVAIKEYFSELNITLPKGFCTEVNLDAIDWLKEVSAGLYKGFVLTIDYGYPSHELYRSDKRFGTLVCYNNHVVGDCIYENAGEQDITSHVNFSALCHWGLKNHLDFCGFTSQALFMRALGLIEYLRKVEKTPEYFKVNKEQKSFFMNTFLNDMGNKMKVLIQQKGVASKKLSGMNFYMNQF